MCIGLKAMPMPKSDNWVIREGLIDTKDIRGSGTHTLALMRFRSSLLARKPARAPRTGSGPGTGDEGPSRLI
jgi:hypothetical protein